MTTSRSGRPRRTSETDPVSVRLTRDEMTILISVSVYYGRVLGTIRRMIELASPSEMREKARFVREESYWLRKFTVAAQRELERDAGGAGIVRFTPRSLVALYGRLLGTLNLPRTRRKLSKQEIARRENLAATMLVALSALQTENADLVRREIQTRRMREQAWLWDSLGATPPEHAG